MKFPVPARKMAFAGSLMLLVLGCGGGGNSSGPVAVAGMARTISVNDWPFWIDIPIQTDDLDRVWRTTMDIVTERHAVSVMDKESGYIRTEWRPDGRRTEESRYTLRIRMSEEKIRMGIEVRTLPNLNFPTVLMNTPATPWTSMYTELRDRLVTVR